MSQPTVAADKPFILFESLNSTLSIPSRQQYEARIVTTEDALPLYGLNFSRIPESHFSNPSAPLFFKELAFVDPQLVRLSDEVLKGAKFVDCKFSNGKFYESSLQSVTFNRCRFSATLFLNTTLTHCVFENCSLERLDFSRTKFQSCSLRGSRVDDCLLSDIENSAFIDFSGVRGLTSASEFMAQHFYSDHRGCYVWKRLTASPVFKPTSFSPRPEWDLMTPGVELRETVDRNPFASCGSGVNFGTIDWCSQRYPNANLWLCLLPWSSAFETVVPYNSDGKARCSHLIKLKNFGSGGWVTFSTFKRNVMEESWWTETIAELVAAGVLPA